MVAETGRWLTEDLFWLIYLEAYARQRTIQQVVDALLAEFKRRHAPLESVLQDVAGVGEPVTRRQA